MSSFFVLALTALLLSCTSFLFIQSLSVLHFVFWFLVWFILLVSSCYISTRVYVFLLNFLGYKRFFKESFAVYSGLFWRMIPFLAVQLIVEIFADYIICGNLAANLLLIFNLLVYIFLLFKYLPANLPHIIKLVFIVCSLLPQAIVFYLLIK